MSDEKIKLLIETAGVRISIEAPADHIHIRQMGEKKGAEGETDGPSDAVQTGRTSKTQDAPTETARSSEISPRKGERGKSLRPPEGQDEEVFSPSPPAPSSAGKEIKNPYIGKDKAKYQKFRKLLTRLGRAPTKAEMKMDWRGRKIHEEKQSEETTPAEGDETPNDDPDTPRTIEMRYATAMKENDGDPPLCQDCLEPMKKVEDCQVLQGKLYHKKCE